MASKPARQTQITAAEKLFRQKGYLATTARDLAKASGVRGADVDKEKLLWAIASRAADEFFAALRPIVESDEPAQLKLRHAIIAHVGVITRNLDAAAVYFNEWRHLGVRRRNRFARRRDEYEALFRAILREGINAGLFTPVDEKFGSLLILSALNWTHQWYKPDGPLTAEEVGRTLADFLMNGLYRTA
ncbi:MAG: TetR family transcriptional regulator [Chloroflexi bacterium]|nr:TetR family transcriptional regulator [Chloroflexota bacterium]